MEQTLGTCGVADAYLSLAGGCVLSGPQYCGTGGNRLREFEVQSSKLPGPRSRLLLWCVVERIERFCYLRLAETEALCSGEG